MSVETYFKYLVPIAITIGSVFVIGVSYAAYRAWLISRWLDGQFEKALNRYSESDVFRGHVNNAVELKHSSLELKVLTFVSESLLNHNSDMNAHSNVQKARDSMVRELVDKVVTGHNESEGAHRKILNEYATQRDLEVTILRFEEKLEATTKLIVAKTDSLIEKVDSLLDSKEKE